jgi:hypothetical protein
MNNSKRWFLPLIGSGLAVLLLVGLLVIGPAFAQGPGGMMGGGGYSGTMPGGYGPGGMLGYNQTYTGTVPYGYGPGMMGNGFGMMGMMGTGFGHDMMGSFGSNALFGIEPLSLDQAQTAVQDYLTRLDDADLAVGEVMVFDNHAYAQVVEQGSGIGAFEVLVDPVTLAVSPEPGPNMMWNSKYSPMTGFGGFGPMGMMGMMGSFGFQGQNNMTVPGGMMGGTTIPDLPSELPFSPADAVEAAQRYLDVYLPGAQADEHADAFYGYYTLHLLRDGETVGMLSVNGYTGQVFLHTWHGDLVEMGGE